MQSVQTYRPISQVEAEMHKAVTAFTAAEERLRQSQSSVNNAVRRLEEARSQHQDHRREYDTALDSLNACQSEMEASFAALQESSPNGSLWQRSEKVAERTSALGLHPSSESDLIDPSTYVMTGSDSIDIASPSMLRRTST